MQLLVATHNKGKVAEINTILAQSGIECLTLDAAGVTFDVEETGTTFLENAALKATQYAKATGLLTLADDSGLQVDAMDGAPGVYTARFGGAHLTQPERNQLIMETLDGVPDGKRGAQFVCTMVLCDGSGAVLGSAEGVCSGTINTAPVGDGGFGYDPIFFLPDQNVTMAQLTKAEKQAISHRGQALKQIIPLILLTTLQKKR